MDPVLQSKLMDVLVFVGLLILLAFANQALFEELVAKLIVDPAVAKTSKEWIKKLQPFLVILAGCLISLGLGEPLTNILGDVIPLPMLNDPVLSVLANGLLIGAASFKVHDAVEIRNLQKSITSVTAQNMKMGIRGG